MKSITRKWDAPSGTSYIIDIDVILVAHCVFNERFRLAPSGVEMQLVWATGFLQSCAVIQFWKVTM